LTIPIGYVVEIASRCPSRAIARALAACSVERTKGVRDNSTTSLLHYFRARRTTHAIHHAGHKCVQIITLRRHQNRRHALLGNTERASNRDTANSKTVCASNDRATGKRVHPLTPTRA